ncbi:MAG: response regulator [Bradyrhizobium sp.]|nr:MAG: response regulator [Bradyrhizobium sp.]
MPRTLVVYDDPTVRATIEVLLQRQDFDVMPSDGGETGIAAREPQTFGAMLVEILMPYMRCSESIRIFHERPRGALLTSTRECLTGAGAGLQPKDWKEAP